MIFRLNLAGRLETRPVLREQLGAEQKTPAMGE